MVIGGLSFNFFLVIPLYALDIYAKKTKSFLASKNTIYD